MQLPKYLSKGFTITQWVRFKDKVSTGTLFNYGNPLREHDPSGFMLETFVLNAHEDIRSDGGIDYGGVQAESGYVSPVSIQSSGNYDNWKEMAEHYNYNYFDDNDTARFIRLVVRESVPHNNISEESILNTRDSHVGAGDLTKKYDIAKSNSESLAKRFLTTTNVPIDLDEWYFIVATYNPNTVEDVAIATEYGGDRDYWNGNILPPDQTSPDGTVNDTGEPMMIHESGFGNKCKVEIISKTQLITARGFKFPEEA